MINKVVFIPGNGGCDIETHSWFTKLRNTLQEKGIPVHARNMPDPDLARMRYWLPFMKDELKIDAQTVAIGHSSGAVALLRYAEKKVVGAIVLIGVYKNDLGDEMEMKSGYFDTAWNWKNIKNNVRHCVIMNSQDDPHIPISHPRFIHEQLDAEYHEYLDQGHFGVGTYEVPNLVEIIQRLYQRL